MKVQVKEIPIRYGKRTYRAGESFDIEEAYLTGVEKLVEVVELPDKQKPLDTMTVAELKEYAAEKGMDLEGAEKKQDILAAIQQALEAKGE